MSKSYKLLTTAIVTALDIQNPTARGVIWTPAEVMDIQEADALVKVGIAEETKDKATVETIAARQSKPAVVQPEPVSEDEDDTPLLAILEGSVPEIEDALVGLNAAQLVRLRELETDGKGRKGVFDAIGEYDIED